MLYVYEYKYYILIKLNVLHGALYWQGQEIGELIHEKEKELSSINARNREAIAEKRP